MNKTVIADSSPLIVLLKSDLEEILPKLFDEVLVPSAVYQEILQGGNDDVAKQKLPLLSWIRRISKTATNREIDRMI